MSKVPMFDLSFNASKPRHLLTAAEAQVISQEWKECQEDGLEVGMFNICLLLMFASCSKFVLMLFVGFKMHIQYTWFHMMPTSRNLGFSFRFRT